MALDLPQSGTHDEIAAAVGDAASLIDESDLADPLRAANALNTAASRL